MVLIFITLYKFPASNVYCDQCKIVKYYMLTEQKLPVPVACSSTSLSIKLQRGNVMTKEEIVKMPKEVYVMHRYTEA